MEDLTHLKFQPAQYFKLPGNQKRCYLAIKGKAGRFPLNLSYFKKEQNERNNIFQWLGEDLVEVIEVLVEPFYFYFIRPYQVV